MGKKVEGLEDHAHFGAEFSEVAAFLGEVFTVDSDGSAGGCFEAVNGSAQG